MSSDYDLLRAITFSLQQTNFRYWLNQEGLQRYQICQCRAHPTIASLRILDGALHPNSLSITSLSLAELMQILFDLMLIPVHAFLSI